MNDDIEIIDGLYEVDEKYVSKRPPKIKWGNAYKEWNDQKKVEYLEKLVNSLNHSVSLIQGERDELNTAIALKEAQLTQVTKDMRANSMMVQQEIARMNDDRNAFRQTIKKLDLEIKGFKNAANN